MSCSCNDKVVDFCHKPKVSDWQLDIVRSMIKCLCKCGDTPVDVPSCIATYVSARPIDGFPELITYSKNGGPFREISVLNIEPDGLFSLVAMLKNESHTGFAFTLAESESSSGPLVEFCGLNSDGAYVSSENPDGIIPTELIMPNGMYPGPFNVISEKTTLTFKETVDVPAYKDFFQCLDNPTGASTLTLESCAILEVFADPLPPTA